VGTDCQWCPASWVSTRDGGVSEAKGDQEMDVLHVDCDSCVARGPACSDCVISVLIGTPGGSVDLDAGEQAALSALAESGLVPPLRLIPGIRPARPVQAPLNWQEHA
jgi:hypothetical protein